MTPPLCQYLEWDSAFFGFRIGRVGSSRLTDEEMGEVLAWCEAERIRCLYMLADSADGVTARLAYKEGFRFVDVQVTLERSLGSVEIPAAVGVRPALESDVSQLAEIARVSHVDSRFYFDGGFGRDRCDELYTTWIERSCRDNSFADVVLVSEQGSRPAGYVTCSMKKGVGQIGLIAVAEWAQGGGHGRSLVQSALNWAETHGASEVRVVTQGRNIRAQRLYQRAGFVSASANPWYHRWFPAV